MGSQFSTKRPRTACDGCRGYASAILISVPLPTRDHPRSRRMARSKRYQSYYHRLALRLRLILLGGPRDTGRVTCMSTATFWYACWQRTAYSCSNQSLIPRPRKRFMILSQVGFGTTWRRRRQRSRILLQRPRLLLIDGGEEVDYIYYLSISIETLLAILSRTFRSLAHALGLVRRIASRAGWKCCWMFIVVLLVYEVTWKKEKKKRKKKKERKQRKQRKQTKVTGSYLPQLVCATKSSQDGVLWT